MEVFYYDDVNSLKRTYKSFAADVEAFDHGDASVVVVKDRDYYLGYVKIVSAIALDRNVLLLDEMDCEDVDLEVFSAPSFQRGKANLKDFCVNSTLFGLFHSSKSKIFFKTSGTTGKPKVVAHKIADLIKSVVRKDYHQGQSWLTSFHPYHMAGIQVFLQVLSTGSSLTYLNSFKLSGIDEVLLARKVTYISSTPTFFKQVYPLLSGKVFTHIKSLGFGGEKIDPSFLEKMKSVFPNSKVKNIFATTETGSLFISDGETFVIKESIKKFIKVDSDSKLLIHHSILGEFVRSDMNLSDGKDEWYSTGDVVELVDGGTRLKIVGRHSEFINIGGNKVNPHKVESTIQSHPKVKFALVSERKNSVLGSVLVSKVSLEENVDAAEFRVEIQKYCKERLEPWEVPLKFEVVDIIEVGLTGKAIRK